MSDNKRKESICNTISIRNLNTEINKKPKDIFFQKLVTYIREYKRLPNDDLIAIASLEKEDLIMLITLYNKVTEILIDTMIM